MPLPVGVEAADHQPEEPVPGLEVASRTSTEGDLELVAQYQVVDQKVAPLPEELASLARKMWSRSSILAGSPIRPDPSFALPQHLPSSSRPAQTYLWMLLVPKVDIKAKSPLHHGIVTSCGAAVALDLLTVSAL